jgi:hypothetical protein
LMIPLVLVLVRRVQNQAQAAAGHYIYFMLVDRRNYLAGYVFQYGKHSGQTSCGKI